MNRLIVWREECDGLGRVALTDRRAEHIRAVLKCGVGDTLRAGFANECAATATVVSVEEGRCVVEVRENSGETLPPPMIDVMLALPRPRFLARILPQLPPLGVRRIFLCDADRVEKSFFGSQLLKRDNYLPVLVEGVEQGGGVVVPEVRVVRNLRQLIQDIATDYDHDCKLVAHPATLGTPGANPATLPRAGLVPGVPRVVAIGCEGGWTEREVAWMEEAGFRRFSLGERTLRTDTACIAVLAVVGFLCYSGTNACQ